MNAWEEKILDRQEARAEGIKTGKIEDAKKMLEKNIPIKDIAEITGLSED